MNNHILAFEEKPMKIHPIPYHLVYDVKNKSPHSEEVMDEFTSRFEGEDELKEFLHNVGIADESDLICPIEKYFYDTKLRRNADSIIYKNDLKYLDHEYLKGLFLEIQDNKNILNAFHCKFNENNNKYRDFSLGFKAFIAHILDLSQGKSNILNWIDYLPYNELKVLALFMKEQLQKLDVDLKTKEINVLEFKKNDYPTETAA